MNDILKKLQKWQWLIIALVLLGGILVTWMGLRQPINVIVDDEALSVRTAALTIPGVLRSAGIVIEPEDQVFPSNDGLFWDRDVIRVEKARTVLIRTPQEEFSLKTAESIPANLLQTLGIDFFPHDSLLVNGLPVDPQQPIEAKGSLLIQFKPAKQINVEIGDHVHQIYSNQPTLGAALEAAEIELNPRDWISEDISAPIKNSMTVEIRKARPVTIESGHGSLTGMTAAVTVGGALQDLGFPLQNLDYSIPDEDASVPADSIIKIVRVSESLVIATEEIPNESDYQEDPDTPLDQISVIEPGQDAIFANRERIRYEEGDEVWRSPQESWQASEQMKGILGYGTKIQIRSEVVDGQTIEYWRKISVYATSYKPCDANGVCHDGTAGGYPLQQGIIAVSPKWYSVPNGLGMADLSVYVPGYGRAIIGDVCGGCSGSYWIDLAYRDENYVPWYHWTTMYFLTPVPQRYIPPMITP
jgi:uncharacterized protein YabE (DUF348 family)